MRNERKAAAVSIALKFAVAVVVTWGLLKCSTTGGFMGSKTLLLYFTNQSNIWLAVVDIILAVFQLRAFRKGVYSLSGKLYKLQQVFTVSITLTGVVYCFVLLPAFLAQGTYGKMILKAYEQTFLHVVSPLLATVDFLFFTKYGGFKKKDCLWATVPPFYYLGFSIVGFLNNWDFGGGNNYPYFFFNFTSPAGVFGFSDEMPYFMGSFYWIIALIIFVLGVSLLYNSIVNRCFRRMNRAD